MTARRIVSDRVHALAAYQPGEQPASGELLKLNTNENPYSASPRVVEAIERGAATNLHLYPSPMADELRVRAAERYGVAPDQVLVGNGSDELLALCLRACVVDGDVVSYAVPTYSLYRTLAAIAGADVVEVAAGAGEIPAALPCDRARVTFVCTPGAPFGRSVDLDELGALARRSSGLVVADEAYADFSRTTALSILDRHPNMLVLRSFSKSYSLAGLRLGLAFGASSLMADLAKVKDSYNVSRLAIAAGVAALDDEDWTRRNVLRVCATRDRVGAALRAKGFRVHDSDANFLWVDCSASGGGREVYDRLRAQGVLVRFFDAPDLEHGVRVTIGTDEQMDRVLELL